MLLAWKGAICSSTGDAPPGGGAFPYAVGSVVHWAREMIKTIGCLALTQFARFMSQEAESRVFGNMLEFKLPNDA